MTCLRRRCCLFLLPRSEMPASVHSLFISDVASVLAARNNDIIIIRIIQGGGKGSWCGMKKSSLESGFTLVAHFLVTNNFLPVVPVALVRSCVGRVLEGNAGSRASCRGYSSRHLEVSRYLQTLSLRQVGFTIVFLLHSAWRGPGAGANAETAMKMAKSRVLRTNNDARKSDLAN